MDPYEMGRKIADRAIQYANRVERQVVILSADGERVLFVSPRCRMSVNSDGTVSITDLASEDGPPSYIRLLEANARHLEDLAGDE